jgi:ATP-dependent RNA helicase RhlE
MNFEKFDFHPRIAAGIAAAGYSCPTPIQTRAMPQVMKGRDVMGLAQTGTGKTAAFVLPILHRLIQGPHGHRIRALIIAPTRELAEQIHVAVESLGRQTRLRSAVVFGGVGIGPQIQALKQADLVVACPGRLLDHISRRTVDLSHVEVLVLDEADQMFDMGFYPDIRRIINQLPKKDRQTLLFSATMPKEICNLANEVLTDPERVQIGAQAPAETVSHALYPVAQHLKTALLMKLLEHTGTGSVLVFTRTKYRAKSLGEKLAKAGYRSTSLQGNLSQARRQAALNSFRSGKHQILVATDIAARGIDVSTVSHVINYDVPATPESYVHRIGRTGRACCSGEAYTLITDEDTPQVKAITKRIGRCLEKRILPDFDYQVPKTSPMNKPFAPTGRPRPASIAKGKSRGRSQKGAFDWFCSGKSIDPGLA